MIMEKTEGVSKKSWGLTFPNSAAQDRFATWLQAVPEEEVIASEEAFGWGRRPAVIAPSIFLFFTNSTHVKRYIMNNYIIYM